MVIFIIIFSFLKTYKNISSRCRSQMKWAAAPITARTNLKGAMEILQANTAAKNSLLNLKFNK